MDPFAPNRKQLEHDLLDVVIQQASEDKLNEETAQPIAQFVLAHIDNLQNQEQAVKFLEDLCAQWPIFIKVLEIEKGKLSRKQEEVAAQNIADLLKHGNAGKALQVAGQVMKPSPLEPSLETTNTKIE